MTLQEILKANGVVDDIVSKVLAAMKENKIYTASEENLDVRYGKLKTDHESVTKQLETANTTIADLKKANGNNEALQGKVTEYEQTIAQLQEQLKAAQIEAAAQLALRDAKVIDPDYMLFQPKEKGELELDENGKIKGIDDKIAGLKTQFPTQFESNGGNPGMTKAEFLKKPYAERAKFYNENPEAYRELMKS